MIEHEIEEEEKFGNLTVVIRIKGPLFNGNRNSMCKVMLDISYREKVILDTNRISIGRFMEEIPIFDLVVMSKKEILAEKIRALMSRDKARDVYDMLFLVQSGEIIDEKLTNKKLAYYGKKFNRRELLESINLKENIWESEMSGLMLEVPKFKEVVRQMTSLI